MRLQSKVAMLTGVGQGMGRAAATVFAQEGARVAVVDINIETAEEVAGEIGDAAFAIQADVSQDGLLNVADIVHPSHSPHSPG